MAKISAQSQLLSSASGLLFIFGKLVRFTLYFVFLFSVLSGAGNVGGYSREQIIVFFLVFNIIDILIQILFRGVYVFRPLVASGNYDLDLLKPLPSFFRPLFGWTDILDLVTFVPLVTFFVHYLSVNHMINSPFFPLLFLILVVNSILIGFAFHLFVCSICILTMEIDHLVWVYRDLTGMARFPTDIYSKFVQIVLTFTIPVMILISVPAKAILGLLTPEWMLMSLVVGFCAFFLSLKFWFWSLKKYTSASS